MYDKREKFKQRKIEEATDEQIKNFENELMAKICNLKDTWPLLPDFITDHIDKHGNNFWQCLPPGFWCELNPRHPGLDHNKNQFYKKFYILKLLCQYAEKWELIEFRDECLESMLHFNLSDDILEQWKTIYESNLVPSGLVWQLSFFISINFSKKNTNNEEL